MRFILTQAFVFFLLALPFSQFSQNPAQPAKPKLVVGIVIDQLRNDYIYRYWNRFSDGGFKRLVNEGFYFRNAHFNYVPTYTGPGHSSIYTGATPRVHGIIANDWYVKGTFKTTYCTDDKSVEPVGTSNVKSRMSPKYQLSSTIGDELKMSSQQKAKVFSVSLKDRAAILPAGHAANGAFWLDDETGNFVSSSWYMTALPEWVKEFNALKLTKKHLQEGWKTLYSIASYTSSLPDENRYESAIGKEKAVFPYDYSEAVSKDKWNIIKYLPGGNSLTKDFALTCLKNEQLGKGTETDLLCISFSATDYVGHMFGPRSVESEDVYLRLDKDLEEILTTLDKELGKGNYCLFLTADHGAADVPNHLLDYKIPAGYIHDKEVSAGVQLFLHKKYGDSLLLEYNLNEQLFLNEEKINARGLNKNEIEESLCNYLITVPGIAEAYPSSSIKNEAYSGNDFRALIQNGYNHKRSGHVAFIYQSGWMDHSEKGTTHGAAYNYDTHVPVIFFGAGVKKGETLEYISITQIAPSICELLKINQPSGTSSEPLNMYFQK